MAFLFRKPPVIQFLENLFFRQPSAAEMVRRNIEEYERKLVEYQAQEAYCKKMAEYYAEGLARLAKFRPRAEPLFSGNQ